MTIAVASGSDLGDDRKQQATDRFKSVGLQQESAASLVVSIVQAAGDQVLDLITGSGPVPTNLTAARADQLRYVCLHAGRMLRQREVEVLFRTTPTSAKAILTATAATYRTALRTQFLTQMRADVTVVATGSREDGMRWQLRFTQPSTFAFALEELERGRLLGTATRDDQQLAIELDQQIAVGDESVDPLQFLDVGRPTSRRGRRS